VGDVGERNWVIREKVIRDQGTRCKGKVVRERRDTMKSIKKCFLSLLTSLLVVLTLVGCASLTGGIDSGLFTEKPCKAPCWQNLTPGLSTSADVDHFLNNLSTTKWPERSNMVFSESCKMVFLSNKMESIDLHIEKGILTFISSSHLNITTLKKVVDHFGPPEYVKAVLAIGPDGEFYIFEVYYPAQGLAFETMPNQEKDVGYIRENMQVTTIHYFPPDDLLSYLIVKASCEVGYDGATQNAQFAMKFIQPWTGFGEVNVIPSR
jgi:hypothetical protein